jgi:nicotinamidase-related amidase
MVTWSSIAEKQLNPGNHPMASPKTLAELAGLQLAPTSLKESALLMIDCQNTYLHGPMRLVGVEQALDEALRVLDQARQVSAPIFHIAHDAGPGSLYDVQGESGAIATAVAAVGNEPTIIKNYPNSFAHTELHERLQALGINKLIIVGFMTHMCVSSTARGAQDLGYQTTVIESATATRDLPTADGRVLAADQLKQASLAGLSDLVSSVVNSVDDLS